MPYVSIITAAYNMESEIPIFLESLCRSEFKDFDVCLCDDGSQDGTLEAIGAFAGRLDIKVISNATNRGVTCSRNQALTLAGAQLFLFLDADIRVYPDTLTKLLNRMERTKADVVEGIYSDVALDRNIFSQYYALFIHHSFLLSGGPTRYNVFNGWCALCKREVMERLRGHRVVSKGVEIENEALGRRIVANGFSIVMDPEIYVDHHWNGYRKLVFIFTRRVYWWVKIFFAANCEFESALTTRAYGLGTLCLPLAVFAALLGAVHPLFLLLSLALLGGFLGAYAPFYAFAYRRRGAGFLLLSLVLSMHFSFLVSLSAACSGVEEVLRKMAFHRYTLDSESFSR